MTRRGLIARGVIAAAAAPLLIAKPAIDAVEGVLGAVEGDAGSAAPSASDVGAMSARQADDLADFWAVCTHFSFDQYASRLQQVVQLISAAEIRVVRDGWGADSPAADGTSRALTAAGIRLAATNSPSDTHGVETEAAVRAMVEAHASRIGPGLIAAEGWNEPGGWHAVLGDDELKARVLQWQQWVFSAYRETSPYQAIPVGGPSLADSNSSAKWQALELTAWADRATLHDYPGDSYVLRDADFDRFRANGNAMVRRNRIASTETGTTVGRLHAPFAVPDEAAAGILVPRVQWEHFRRGWELSATYEFLDEGSDGDYESGFGLVGHDLRPKPAYTTVLNTLRLLKDPGPKFAPAPLRMTLDGADGATRTVLLQKRDGSYWLAVWQQVQVWNELVGRVASTSQQITLTFDRRRTVTTYDPHTSQAPASSHVGVSAAIVVTEKTTLVEIV